MGKLTKADINAGRSRKGGFTRAQLEKWGVPWPPPKGWKRRLLTGEPVEAAPPAPATEYDLPTVAEVAEHILGREPTEEEIHGEIRADDVVIRYTCIRPTVAKSLRDQLTPPEGFLE